MGGDTANAAGDGGQRSSAGIDETLRSLRDSGRGTLDASVETGRALRRLVSADLALARSALGRALAWTAVSIIFGASAWLLLMGAMIALLQTTGLSWLASIAITALVSLIVMGIAVWRVSVFFDYAGMHATRRQLSRLGLFSEAGIDDDEDGASPGPGATPTP